ncbi:hypothetical protein FRC03_002208 [Tulasnella sp. 419]|nr:hypothetical protein FRC03_002208 [Tulasnella sp. 419]
MESYKSLQSDPIETTNTLLRLLIKHRNDNVTLDASDLYPEGVNPSAVSINATFFASLSFSLTAAFGAVTAKQWLNEYSNTGVVKPLHRQGRERQAKFQGLETWHFRFIMNLLPALLQLSLLLFLIGLVEFLWILNWRVAAIQLAFTAAGVAVYVATIIIGVIVPTSPFQTPLSKYILGFGSMTQRFIRTITSSVACELRSAALQRLYDTYCSPFLLWGQQHVLGGLKFSLKGFRWRSEEVVSSTTDMAKKPEWSSSEEIAAECVVWLLEHSEHLDTTIAALHASLHLPSQVLVPLIDKREGLYESWNREMVAFLALFHLFKLTDFDDMGMRVHIVFDKMEEPFKISIETVFDSSIVIWLASDSIIGQKWLQPRQLRIELTDERQTAVTYPLIVSWSPAHLFPQIIACKFLYESMDDLISVIQLDYSPFPEILQVFHLLLEDHPLTRTIGYVSIALAAMHWRLNSDSDVSHWGYSSVEEKQRFRQGIIRSLQAFDQRHMVSESVALALSLWEPSCPEQLSSLYDRLLHLIDSELIRGSSLATVLLRLYWKHAGESRKALILQALHSVFRLLSLELDMEQVSSLLELVKQEISLSKRKAEPTTGYLSAFIDKLADVPDDDLFRSIFLSATGPLNESFESVLLKDTWKLTTRLQQLAPSIPDHLPEVWAYLVNQTLRSVLKAGQSGLGDGMRFSLIFLHHLISVEAGLHWPTYFPPELVISIANLKIQRSGHFTKWENHGDLDNLKQNDFRKALLGESVLLSWRAAHKIWQDGKLPSSWNDTMFFGTRVTDLMLDYYSYVRGQGFVGVDYCTLRRYLEAFLKTSRDRGSDHDDQVPWQTWHRVEESFGANSIYSWSSRGASVALIIDVPLLKIT